MNAITPTERRRAEMSWKVIDMARQDGPRSLNPEGFAARAARKLFGVDITRRLASDTLEMLRRFAVRAWYWDYVPARELRQLLDAGYTMADAKRILAYVALHRGFTPTIIADPA